VSNPVFRKQVSIPTPTADIPTLTAVATATKELVETLAAQRGDPLDHAVTWNDLLNMGIVTPDQVPGFRGRPSG
jgi:hypothetical protein